MAGEALEADFVIVGAGSAGCVLANRLTADGKTSVILIEAGNDDRPLARLSQLRSNLMIQIPIGYAETLKDPRVSWNFLTEPDPGTGGRQHVWPRGKVLGGSSSINAMLYVRGQSADYEGWKAAGCEGWGWSDVLPYFIKAEDQAHGASAVHGTDGPLRVEDIRCRSSVSDAVIRASIEAGLPATTDINGPDQEGASWFQVTQKRGRRWSTATAYLHPVSHRSTLRVVTGALSTRVVIDAKRATGVEFREGGQLRIARARREVILSAGAIGSPQLLQLSGIGPGEVLRAAGIPVVHDNGAVGGNLHDHFQPQLRFRLKPGTPSLNRVSRGLPLVGEALRYFLSRRGFLALPAATVGIFCKSTPDLATPDIQFHVLPASLDLEEYGKNGKFVMEGKPGLTMAPCQLRPESRGSINIQSADPAAPPRILANYLDHALDQAVVVAGLRWGRRLAEQPSLAAHLESELSPGEALRTDAELLDFARASGATAYHPVGTCAMGSTQESVLDPQLRVRGVQGLRVVDASAMPRIVSGNTNAATIMIAEKASDLILADIGQA